MFSKSYQNGIEQLSLNKHLHSTSHLVPDTVLYQY